MAAPPRPFREVGNDLRLEYHQHGDCPRFIALMDQLAIRRRGKGHPRARPGAALGDKAYSSAANRVYLRKRGIKAVIPVKEDQKNHRRNRGSHGGRPPAFDAEQYKDRNTVGRCLGKLKQFRAVATRGHGCFTGYARGWPPIYFDLKPAWRCVITTGVVDRMASTPWVRRDRGRVPHHR